MAYFDRGFSTPAGEGLLKELQECRSDCNFYRRRLVQANKIVDVVREMARLEDIPLVLANALEEYDALPLEPPSK